MENNELILERQDRILKTMNGEKTDRTPAMWSGDVGLFRYAKPDATFADILNNYGDHMDTLVNEVLPQFPKVDMLEAVGSSPRFLGMPFLLKTALPGIDLPENEMWTLKFDHAFDEDVYRKIIDEGWDKFFAENVFGRCGYDPVAMGEELGRSKGYAKMLHDAGLPFKMGGGPTMGPFDILAFGRGQVDFYVDMLEQEDEVIEAMNIMMEADLAMMDERVRAEVAEAKAAGEEVMYCVIPCVNANTAMLSREQFEKFGWPLFERQTNFFLDRGCLVRFHMDCRWDEVLDYFTVFPKGRCIFDTDGETDLDKVQDVLGGTMAFTGSIAPADLAFSDPDTVYRLQKEQIEHFGDSFIASPSCTIPANVPKENLDAMYAAIAE